MRTGISESLNRSKSQLQVSLEELAALFKGALTWSELEQVCARPVCQFPSHLDRIRFNVNSFLDLLEDSEPQKCDLRALSSF